jgi:hypothetical protein
LNRVGPIARQQNEESRRENEREAARRLEEIRERLDFDTHDLTSEQREKALAFARDLVTRLTAETWAASNGWTIPADRASVEYRELFAAWIESSEEE